MTIILLTMLMACFDEPKVNVVQLGEGSFVITKDTEVYVCHNHSWMNATDCAKVDFQYLQPTMHMYIDNMPYSL